jgi:hypothetical protein
VLADRLATLITDANMRQRMGAQAKVEHERRYTFAAFERNLAAALMACTRPTAPASLEDVGRR